MMLKALQRSSSQWNEIVEDFCNNFNNKTTTWIEYDGFSNRHPFPNMSTSTSFDKIYAYSEKTNSNMKKKHF